jgi:purine-nucleoside/S-methyl-5'-thioadenosine phosphorylase / adenosine deaminase
MSGEGEYITVPALERIPDLVHGFGTRTFDIAALRSLAAKNRCRIVQLAQIHSADVVVARLSRKSTPPRRGDALATDRAGLLLAVRTADCLPVLFADPDKRVVAAVHAGWRGTRSRILERAVDTLVSRFGCRPGSLFAALGPCIGAECYEVGPDVRREFAAAGQPLFVFRPSPRRAGSYLLDLAAANRRQLLGRGLSSRRVLPSASCTHCDARLLSFRRDRDAKARLYNFIGFRPS